MKKLAMFIGLALLAFPGCSTSEPNRDYDIGTQPEDLEMEATVDTSDLDPYQ